MGKYIKQGWVAGNNWLYGMGVYMLYMVMLLKHNEWQLYQLHTELGVVPLGIVAGSTYHHLNKINIRTYILHEGTVGVGAKQTKEECKQNKFQAIQPQDSPREETWWLLSLSLSLLSLLLKTGYHFTPYHVRSSNIFVSFLYSYYFVRNMQLFMRCWNLCLFILFMPV